MRYLRPLLCFLAASTMAIFVGCPSTPLNASLLGMALHLVPQVNAASGIPTAVLFDYDFTQPLNKACSSTVTSNCVSGFTVTLAQGSTAIGSPVSVALPATISSTGPTVGISGALPAISAMGQYTVTVQVMFKDATGTVQGGPVAALNFPLTPSGVANIRVQ